jgi:hypothetical protein
MLDREVIKEILEEELEYIEIPSDAPIEILIEIFCQYIEDNYYEWIKDNFNSFFIMETLTGIGLKKGKNTIQKIKVQHKQI